MQPEVKEWLEALEKLVFEIIDSVSDDQWIVLNTAKQLYLKSLENL